MCTGKCAAAAADGRKTAYWGACTQWEHTGKCVSNKHCAGTNVVLLQHVCRCALAIAARGLRVLQLQNVVQHSQHALTHVKRTPDRRPVGGWEPTQVSPTVGHLWMVPFCLRSTWTAVCSPERCKLDAFSFLVSQFAGSVREKRTKPGTSVFRLSERCDLTNSRLRLDCYG